MDEIPIPEAQADSSDAMMDDEGAQASGEKRQGGDVEELRAATRQRIAALCSLVHGDVGAPEPKLGEGYSCEGDPELQRLIAALIEEDEEVNAEAVQWWENPTCNRWCEEETSEFEAGMKKELVDAAKSEEVASFVKRGVYDAVPRSKLEGCEDGVLLTTKWVVTNKGSEKEPVAKARLVAREFVSSRIDRDTLFSGTPGLSSFRLVASRAATRSRGGRQRILMVLDVKTAFLYGQAKRNLFIELPEHDPHFGKGDYVGQLRRSLYGTRDAPQCWGEEIGATLRELGFRESSVVPSVFVHDTRDLLLCLHVDDFLVCGPEEDAIWLRDSLMQKYELKSEILGPEAHHKKQANYLKREIIWEDHGITIKADGKHSVEFLKTLGMEACKTVNTPNLQEYLRNDVDKIPEQFRGLLNPVLTRAYRKCVALLVFMSQDRADLSVTACALAKYMQAPTLWDMQALKRAGQYLKGFPSYSVTYDWQDGVHGKCLRLFTDSDWAGDAATRRSSSGGSSSWETMR